MKRDSVIRAAVFCALVVVAAAVRLTTETPNFGAVTAAALFAGFYFRHRAVALCVPLLAMATSDQFLGGYDKGMMLAVYASLAVPIAWRGVLRRHLSPLTVGGGAVFASLSHYLLSNAAVWYAWYPRSWAGVAECYVSALPFLANALKGDLFFAAMFFGTYALAVRLEAKAAPLLASEAA